MNYTRLLLLACSMLTLLYSCVSDPERHQLSPVEKSFILYADQTIDSLLFYTFDSWTATRQPNCDWMAFATDSSANIKYDYSKRYFCRVVVSFKPNTTGKTRYSYVLVESYDYSYSSPFVQLGMLNVSHPAYTPDSWLDEQSGIPESVHFTLTDSANWTTDSICFTVENSWRLLPVGETLPDWLTLNDKNYGSRGKHTVNLTLTENTDTENGREAMLRLISSGEGGEVTNLITVHQLPAKKAE